MLLLVGARDGCYININIEGPNCAVALKLLIDIMKKTAGEERKSTAWTKT